MADKNRNGIPDDREVGPIISLATGSKTATKTKTPTTKSVVSPQTNGPLSAPTSDWWNYVDTANGVKKVGNSFPQAPAVPEPDKTFADYLQQAIGMLGSQGSGGAALVNYDPQRATLRQNASDNDSRLEAMYRQLRGSIDADAPMLQQGYQTAIDSTNANTQGAQQQAQAATDSANSRNDTVLANLGIQQAAGNQIQEGRDLSSQTARNIGDMATRGQAADNRLVSNERSALDNNTNIGNAAGLEGNLQRAANQSKLQSLLSSIDMQEQQQNASARATAGQNNFSQQLSLAQQIMGQDQYNQGRQDDLQIAGAKQAAADKAAAAKKGLPDLGTYLQALGIAPADVAKDPAKYASLLGNLTKYQLTQ